jgi:predicted transcriptional regulator
MNERQTKSWIFLAISVAAEVRPSDFAGISMIADGINHAVPTHKEMQTSISYLLGKELIEKKRNKYSLTPKGASLIGQAKLNKNTYLQIWKELERLL